MKKSMSSINKYNKKEELKEWRMELQKLKKIKISTEEVHKRIIIADDEIEKLLR